MTVLRRLIFDSCGRLDGADQYGPADLCSMGRRRPAERENGHGPVLAELGRAVESQIIPRLLANHRSRRQHTAAAATVGSAPSADEVAEFTRILLANEPTAARSFVEAMLAGDLSLETIYLDLLTPAAQRLGELWDADLCHFTEVTMALGWLQHLLRNLGGSGCDFAAGGDYGRRALLVSAPGEQHTFGGLMVAQFLRQAGWDVTSEIDASSDHLIATVCNEWFAFVGFSVGADRHVSMLAPQIRAIRRSSRNADIAVMVGGTVFLEHPRLVALVGADATAADARQAVAQAEKVLAQLPALSFASGGG